MSTRAGVYYIEFESEQERNYRAQIAQGRATEVVPNNTKLRLALMLIAAVVTALPIAWLTDYALVLFDPIPVIAIAIATLVAGFIVVYRRLLEWLGKRIIRRRIKQIHKEI